MSSSKTPPATDNAVDSGIRPPCPFHLFNSIDTEGLHYLDFVGQATNPADPKQVNMYNTLYYDKEISDDALRCVRDNLVRTSRAEPTASVYLSVYKEEFAKLRLTYDHPYFPQGSRDWFCHQNVCWWLKKGERLEDLQNLLKEITTEAGEGSDLFSEYMKEYVGMEDTRKERRAAAEKDRKAAEERSDKSSLLLGLTDNPEKVSMDDPDEAGWEQFSDVLSEAEDGNA